MTRNMRVLAAGVALAFGLTGAAQAEPFNIFTASQGVKLETVKHGGKHGGKYKHAGKYKHGGKYKHSHRHRRHYDDDWRKAAFAIGTIGAIAGAAAYHNRYYDDGYYYDDGPGYYEDDGPVYYEGGDYGDYDDYCNNPQRPKHYPAPPGC